MKPLIRGEQVFLRHPVAADEAEFLSLRRESRDLHAPWEPLATDVMKPAAFARLIDQADTARHQKHVVCRVEDGRICGYIGLNEIVMGAYASAFVGYWTGSPFVRMGYATEALRLCLKRAFSTLDLHRVEANVLPNNVASLSVVKRCGLRREGYSRHYLKIGGAWQDHERWAITIEDWAAANAARAATGSRIHELGASGVEPRTGAPDPSNGELEARLIAAAREVQLEMSLGPERSAGSVGSALLSEGGAIHTGLCVHLACGIGFCAEHAAVAEMLKHRETRVMAIVAVGPEGVLALCGRCRELLLQVDPANADTVVLLGGGRTAKLSALLPAT